MRVGFSRAQNLCPAFICIVTAADLDLAVGLGAVLQDPLLSAAFDCLSDIIVSLSSTRICFRLRGIDF